jgi:hypothetical protein
MGIDGIGGGGGPPKIGGDGMAPGAAGSARRTGAEFSMDPSGSVGAKSDAAGDAELGALQRGELTRDQYLERRVDNAVSHLQSVLGPEQMQLLREQLREQLDADPVLRRLVQRATGSGEADDEG